MASQEELIVRLGLDASKFESELRREQALAKSSLQTGGQFTPQTWAGAEKYRDILAKPLPGGGFTGMVQAAVTKFGAALSETSPALGGFVTKLGTIAPALSLVAIPLGAAALAWKSLKGALDSAHAVAEKADMWGTSAGFVQKLSKAAKYAGEDVAGLETKMAKFLMVLGSAAEGSQEALDTFKKLGVDPFGKDAGEVFAEVAEKIGKMTNAAQRASAMKSLGFAKGDLGMLHTMDKFSEMKGRSVGLDEQDIANMDLLWAKLHKRTVDFAGKVSGTVKWWAGQVAGFWLEKSGSEPGNVPAPMKVTRQADPDAEAKRAAELSKARKEYSEALVKTYSTQGQLMHAQAEQHDLEHKLKAAVEGTAEKEKLKLAVLEKHIAVRELTVKLTDAAAAKAEKQLQFEKAMGAEGAKRLEIERQKANFIKDQSAWSLQELADTELQMVGRGRKRRPADTAANKQILDARRVLDAQQFAHDVRLRDPKAAEVAIQDAERIRNGIEALSSGDKNRLDNFGKQLADVAEATRGLLDAATKDGLVIKPRMGA